MWEMVPNRQLETRQRESALLVILCGFSGAGKTTLARALARDVGAVLVRIDSIEDALREFAGGDMADVGYRVGYAIAEDNLRLGRVVIADSVNPVAVTQAAWRDVAARAGARAVEVEVRRGGRRLRDEAGVVAVETEGRTVAECVGELRATMGL
jgi:predicted kinase